MMTTTTSDSTTNGKHSAASPKPRLEELKVSSIYVGKQPRKRFDQVKLAELAEDVARRGVLEPLLVRPALQSKDQPLPYHLVFGERRLRATKLAGLETVPAMVREMSDVEVLETQIVENAQREDIHPLDEADAYRELHVTHGKSVEDIAVMVGKSVPAVYARLKLCSLCAEGREAFYSGELTAGTAIFVARIPSEDLQREALAKLREEAAWSNDVDGGEEDPDEPRTPLTPLGVRDAARIMQKHFMLRLDGAPFSITDANLLPVAGACSTCPKRTGAQPELFSDVKSADTCTDPVCFGDKKAAAVAQTLKEAKKAGQRVLTKEETKAVFPFGSHVASSAPYVDLAEKRYIGAGHVRTLKAIIGKNAPPPILAVDGDGKIHELVPISTATKALKAAEKEKKPSKGVSSHEKFDRDQRDNFDAVDEGNRRAIAELASKAVGAEPATLWRAIAVEMCHICYDADFIGIAERRGLKNTLSSTFKAAALKMTAGQARGLALELLASAAVSAGDATFLASVFQMFKIDVKKHKAAAQAEKKTAAKAKSAKKKAGRG